VIEVKAADSGPSRMESEQSESRATLQTAKCATVWGDRKGALVCEAKMESDFGAFADLLQEKGKSAKLNSDDQVGVI
jgi:hypothetical protein